MELPEDIFLVDKPLGITSFDVIRDLRRQTGVKKWGHAGTLDPLATGLMVLARQKETKRLTEFVKLDKEYVAEVLLGEKRSTGDMEGEILEEKEVSEISQSEISVAVQKLVGILTLPVSAYSAIKKEGKPMYKRAREAEKTGELVLDVPILDMVVHEAELLNVKTVESKSGDDYNCVDKLPLDKSIAVNRDTRVVISVRFHVGSGTYIRSLAEELGRLLGYPATLFSLRRTKVGEFNVRDAQKLKDIS